jgi:uncharacterized membrane protein
VSELATLLVSVLGVFMLALFVRLTVRNRDRAAFASILVLIGVVSAVGLSFDLDLTADLTLMVFLPAIILAGTTTLDVRRLWRSASLIAVLTIVGLPLAVLILGRSAPSRSDFRFSSRWCSRRSSSPPTPPPYCPSSTNSTSPSGWRSPSRARASSTTASRS